MGGELTQRTCKACGGKQDPVTGFPSMEELDMVLAVRGWDHGRKSTGEWGIHSPPGRLCWDHYIAPDGIRPVKEESAR